MEMILYIICGIICLCFTILITYSAYTMYNHNEKEEEKEINIIVKKKSNKYLVFKNDRLLFVENELGLILDRLEKEKSNTKNINHITFKLES